jgi:predicted nucleotidyltransferase
VKSSLAPFLSSNEQQAVTEFLELLYKGYPERVMQTALFGSKARGDGRPWSDIDVLVVVDQDDWRLSHAISTLAADVSLKYDVLIGPRVIGQERWQQMEKLHSGLHRNIVAESIALT